MRTGRQTHRWQRSAGESDFSAHFSLDLPGFGALSAICPIFTGFQNGFGVASACFIFGGRLRLRELDTTWRVVDSEPDMMDLMLGLHDEPMTAEEIRRDVRIPSLALFMSSNVNLLRPAGVTGVDVSSKMPPCAPLLRSSYDTPLLRGKDICYPGPSICPLWYLFRL